MDDVLGATPSSRGSPSRPLRSRGRHWSSRGGDLCERPRPTASRRVSGLIEEGVARPARSWRLPGSSPTTVSAPKPCPVRTTWRSTRRRPRRCFTSGDAAKHSGVVSAVGRLLVRERGLDDRAGRLLRSLFERRSQADYGLRGRAGRRKHAEPSLTPRPSSKSSRLGSKPSTDRSRDRVDGEAEVGVRIKGVVARWGGDRDVVADAAEREALSVAGGGDRLHDRHGV